MVAEIDISPKPDGMYRIAVWTVGPSIERRYPRLQALEADVVVAARSGNEVRLLKANRTAHSSMAWVGRHAQRGLGVLGFEPTFAKLDGGVWDQRLEWIAPVSISGPVAHNLLAVWALNEKAQVKFKSNPQTSQPIQMMRLYQKTLKHPTVVAGDFNNNPVFHRNDPNWDMLELIALLEAQGLVSAYHAFTGLDHGDPREQPTRFRPDTIVETAAHHVDYCFIPTEWLPALRDVQLGSPEAWFPTVRAEEHVPLVVDFDQAMLTEIIASMRKKSRSR
ncbi:MAG: hypothetical protein R8J94_08150 [Acidimicrobiia bacterium]|nr:hypothetical protein [Acidimicrobiia bacterium]